jgi:hypothetical protein
MEVRVPGAVSVHGQPLRNAMFAWHFCFRKLTFLKRIVVQFRLTPLYSGTPPRRILPQTYFTPRIITAYPRNKYLKLMYKLEFLIPPDSKCFSKWFIDVPWSCFISYWRRCTVVCGWIHRSVMRNRKVIAPLSSSGLYHVTVNKLDLHVKALCV